MYCLFLMNDYDEHEEIILRTYNKVWKIDRKIYSIEGLKLLFPISTNEAIYFIVSMTLSILLTKIIPFYNNLNGVLKYGAVPYGLMKFLTKQKLDGKLPHKFFYDYLMYLIMPKQYERFKPIDSYKLCKFATPIVYRQPKVIDKTEMIINKVKKGRGNNR